MHKREQCEHGTVVSNCRCSSPGKQTVIVACPPHCKFYGKQAKGVASEITYFFAVTVVPRGEAELRRDKSREYYVFDQGSSESLHALDVMDVLRDELDSLDKPSNGSDIHDCLWQIKSVKIHKKERVRAIDEDGGA